MSEVLRGYFTIVPINPETLLKQIIHSFSLLSDKFLKPVNFILYRP